MKDFCSKIQSQGFGSPNSNKEAIKILECKKILREKILKRASFFGNEEKKENVSKLFERTVFHGESNSALLIGPPGSGKSTLVRSVLEELSNNKAFRKQAVVVKLNGLIHTDDRLALMTISKQMNLENLVDDRVTGTFAENMLLLLDTLKTKGRAQAVVFILEEVALFCSHHNQTLLYNLFDIAHSNQASVCVLGVTSRLDVLDLMEKRVKSRFSHRHIHLMPQGNEQGFKQRMELCKELLNLDGKDIGSAFASKWNNHVEALLQNNSVAYYTLKRLFDADSREQATKDFLMQVICHLNMDHPQLLGSDFESVIQDITADDRSRMVLGVSTLELCLVIAMKQLIEIYQGEPINFEMVYNRYLKFAKKSQTQESPREVILKAFEHLQALEILLPVTGGMTGSRVQREYQLHHFQLTPQQVKNIIKNYQDLPEEIKQWSDESLL